MALCIHFDDRVFLLQSEWLGPRLQSDQGARRRRCSLVETFGPGGDPRGRRIVKITVILHEIPTNLAVESAERRLGLAEEIAAPSSRRKEMMWCVHIGGKASSDLHVDSTNGY